MKKIIKGILIDSITETIEEIEIEVKGDSCYHALCKLLNCDGLEHVALDEEDETNLLYVDSLGLLKPQEKYLKIKDHAAFLPPRAIVIGYNEELDNYKDHSLDINDFKNLIMFLSKKEAKALAQMIDQQNAKWADYPMIFCQKLSDLFN